MENDMTGIKRIFIFSLSLLCSACMLAGSFRHLSVGEGLSSRQVYQVCKDSIGFVWIYTHMGVDRYDGNEIKHYKLDETAGLKEYVPSFTTMDTDEKGELRIALRNGRIYKYDGLKDAFELQVDLEGLTAGPILNDVEFEGDKGMWLCLSTGLYFWDSEDRALVQAGLAGEWTNCIVRKDRNTFFVGTDAGVYKLERTGTERRFRETRLDMPVSTRIETLFIFNGKLYIGTFSQGAFVAELSGGKAGLLNSAVANVPIRVFAHTAGRSVLIGTDGAGVYEISDADGTIVQHYTNSEDRENGLNGNTVSDICVDEYGGVWVSTSTDGLSYMDPNTSDVHWIKHERNNPHSLVANHVNVMLQDADGDFWYGTNNGISLYRVKSNRWTHYLNGKEEMQSSVVLALCEDNEGGVWAGGYGIGLCRIDKRSGEVRQMPKRSGQSGKGISTDYLYSIYAEGDCLWFGGIEGNFARYDRRTDTYTYYPIDCIGDIKEGDEAGTLLIAGCNGLGFFNMATGTIKWRQKFGEVTLRYPVRCLMRSSSGELWLATDGDGLVRFNPRNNRCRAYTLEDRLGSNSINSVVEDENGHIWFNTEKELYCLNPATDAIVSGNELLDIDWGYYNANAALKTGDGLLAFGTAEGVLTFVPSFEPSQDISARLIFTDFKLPYESVRAGDPGSPLKTGINNTGEIRLKHNQNSFSISFSAINFMAPHKVRYEYRLKNYEQQWHRVDRVQSVSYMDIPPGAYLFELRAFDSYTQQQTGERTVKILIANPFWASWWAILIYLAVLCIIGNSLIQSRRQKIKEIRIKDKIKSFVGIAHDIRTPLSLIKAPLGELEVQQDLSEDNRKRVAVAAKNVEKLFSMINQLLDLQKAEQHPDSLKVALYDISLYMEEKMADFRPAAMQKEIDLQLEVQPDMPKLWIDKAKMDHIVDNLLSNALKYTEKGVVRVTVKQSKKKWSIEVKDTGIGIPQEEQANIFHEYYRARNVVNSHETGSGIGLMITRRIVQQHRGTISFDSREGQGTTFIVTFPQRITAGIVVDGPVGKDKPETAEAVADASPDANAAGRNVLLLVEDDKDMREYLTDSLSSEYEVVSVPDGGKALEMAKEINPDIIISDVVMPVLQGDELCRILKSSVDTSHIPIVLLTALDERENIILGLEAGATDYIIKPFDLSVLKVRLRNILQNRQQLRETVLSMGAAIEETDYTTQLDKEFLDKVMEVINAEVANSELSINDFCRMLGMSRTSVYNKIKTLTGQGPNDFIRIVRLNKAKELIASRKYAIGEVSVLVGFSDPKYFSTCFKKQFGVSPSKI